MIVLILVEVQLTLPVMKICLKQEFQEIHLTLTQVIHLLGGKMKSVLVSQVVSFHAFLICYTF